METPISSHELTDRGKEMVAKLEAAKQDFSNQIFELIKSRTIDFSGNSLFNLCLLQQLESNEEYRADIIQGSQKVIDTFKDSDPKIADFYALFKDHISNPKNLQASSQELKKKLHGDKEKINSYLIGIMHYINNHINTYIEYIKIVDRGLTCKKEYEELTSGSYDPLDLNIAAKKLELAIVDEELNTAYKNLYGTLMPRLDMFLSLASMESDTLSGVGYGNISKTLQFYQAKEAVFVQENPNLF